MAIQSMSSKPVAVKKGKTQPKVSFSSVQVRMYPITLGHNPGGQGGPPLSISWNYTSLGNATVDDFEEHRNKPQYHRRQLKSLHISPRRRVSLLRKAGFSDKQIMEASREAAKERERRNDSFRQTVLRVQALVRAKKAATQQQESSATQAAEV